MGTVGTLVLNMSWSWLSVHWMQDIGSGLCQTRCSVVHSDQLYMCPGSLTPHSTLVIWDRGIQIVKAPVSILSPRTKGTTVARIAHTVVSIFVLAGEKRPLSSYVTESLREKCNLKPGSRSYLSFWRLGALSLAHMCHVLKPHKAEWAFPGSAPESKTPVWTHP